MSSSFLRITIEFNLNVEPQVPEDLQQALQDLLNRSDDGRHHFSVELIHDGLTRSIQNAIEQKIYEEMIARHKGKIVSNRTGKIVKNVRKTLSASSLASIETAKIMESVKAHIYGNLAVKISQPNND